jgi:hypothetical protein
MPPRPLTNLRKLCLAFPESHEVEAWGEPTFRVRNKLFAMFASPSTHHGNGRPAVWCKAGPGNQGLMVRAAPDRFFVPPLRRAKWLDRGVARSEGALDGGGGAAAGRIQPGGPEAAPRTAATGLTGDTMNPRSRSTSPSACCRSHARASGWRAHPRAEPRLRTEQALRRSCRTRTPPCP